MSSFGTKSVLAIADILQHQNGLFNGDKIGTDESVKGLRLRSTMPRDALTLFYGLSEHPAAFDSSASLSVIKWHNRVVTLPS